VNFPNSGAMDASASCGGPGGMLPAIAGGSPDDIATYAGEMLRKATELTTLTAEFDKAATQLERVWPGENAEPALKTLGDSLAALTEIVDVLHRGAELLERSSDLVETAQVAYRTVVAMVNPAVAALLAGPWTHGAATALSTATTASLRTFISAIAELLESLGAVELAGQVGRLTTVTYEIETVLAGRIGSAPGLTPRRPHVLECTVDGQWSRPDLGVGR
jgi:hypothetical protein